MIKKFITFQDFIAQAYPSADRALSGEKLGGSSVITRTITFQVTDACNLACTYCYQKNKGTRRMSFETAKKFVDLLLSGDKNFVEFIDPKRSKGLVLEFIGGEPLLEIELIDKIVDYVRYKLITTKHPWANMLCLSICSNGVLYRDEKVQEFLQKNKDIMSFSVTVDGNQELHDSCRVFSDGSPSYHLAQDAALDWMSRGYYMGSKITIAPENLQHLYTAFKHFVGMGYEDINANCVYENEWTTEQASVYYKQLKDIADFILSDEKYKNIAFSQFNTAHCKPMKETDVQNWCGGTGVMLSCDPDGNLFPCIRYMESSLAGEREPLCIGDVDNGLYATERHCDVRDCLDCVTRRTQSTDECFYCPIAAGCSWCSAWNYQKNGTVNWRDTSICNMHKARSLASTYFWCRYTQMYGKLDEVSVDLWVPKCWALPVIGEGEYDELVKLATSLGGRINNEVVVKGDFE